MSTLDDATPRACIFDCDGTLLRSMGMWLDAEPAVLATYGYETTSDDFHEFEPLSVADACEGYHRKWGVGKDGSEVYDRLMGILRDGYRTKVTCREGVPAFIEELDRAGVPMAIATSTPAPLVRNGLAANGLDRYFDIIVTTADAGASKDHPDVYDLALERLCSSRGIAVPPRESVWVFEDAVFGLISSGAAGYRRVGIYDVEGRQAREDVFANCEIGVDEFSELSLATLRSYGE